MRKRTFQRRYLFTGTLVLKTGLHIGSGWTIGSSSDNPVIRTPDGRPFIPGSSFKGAFRSTVEKLAPAVGVWSCGLREDAVGPHGRKCIGPQGEAQREFDSCRRNEKWSDETLLRKLDERLCDTCKLFGSPYAASRIVFADLLPPEEDIYADKMIQVRDGVAIDRDSEKAVDRRKYDYEVVAPSQTFRMEILLEDPTETDLGLTCLGLSEFVSGLGYIGGHRSRGLANCRIVGLTIYELDLTVSDTLERAKRLRRYLLSRTPEEKFHHVMKDDETQEFLQKHIEALLTRKEVPHAQATGE